MLRLNPIRLTSMAALLLTLVACASNEGRVADPRDPLEGVNRAVYAFNNGMDRAVVKSVAKGYRAITPEPVDRGVTNFFSNLADVRSSINNLLQFKLGRAASDVGRVAINSTIGILGLIDVASQMKLEKYGEDFGQTLGYWGVGPGPYLVLPFLGPRNMRDTLGMVGDWYTSPLNYAGADDWPDNWTYGTTEDWQWGLHVLNIVDTRSDLLGASAVLEVAAIDEYTFVRDAYLQSREDKVRDGQGLTGDAEEGSEDAPADW
jgi:phospholipid-binding lipoprotein MlaA